MTNGEKIKEVFPNAEINYGLRGVVAVTFIHKTIFDLDWWNAEYEEPSSSEKLNKSETPTSSDDCISRQAVEDAMYDATRAMDLNYGQIMDYIDNLPSVTPIRPKGHWITEISAYGWDRRSYQCSVCGRSIHLDTAVEDLSDYPYCHCGAKMGEEE
jgi:hypothetical protein